MWLARKRQVALNSPEGRILCRRRTPIGSEVPEVIAESLQDGIALSRFADSCCRDSVCKKGRPVVKQLTFRVVSLCTGSFMDGIALHALGKALQKESINVDFDYQALCEHIPFKRVWCCRILQELQHVINLMNERPKRMLQHACTAAVFHATHASSLLQYVTLIPR